MIERHRSPRVPRLDPGVTLLEVDDRATGALHSLVLDHLLVDDGTAVWVDARDEGTTRPLARIAPNLRLLERVAIARAFTPWQHQALLRDLDDAFPAEASLVVAPAFDWCYRSDDLAESEAERLCSAATSLVADVAEREGVPVVLTRTAGTPFAAELLDVVDDVVRCEITAFGPRFAGDDFETLVYPHGDGTVQTTLAYWRQVLATRHPAAATATTPTEVSAGGAN
ncbi:hypothetical protein [Halomicrococcus gelatinilyticus]|uniref:hypothetical protein n=1 Tax=Halomicrococcus gelatinilyticus TaxID=1702103 RepID=UPI002E0DFA38